MIMSNLPFTLRQLEVFSSLSETESFRRCAELLGITQASVSNQIKSLEVQLGATLFARRPGRRPTLTAEGIAFLADLRDFHEAGTKLARHKRRQDEIEEVVHFDVLVGQAMMDRFIKPKLDGFLADNPKVECTFETQPPFEKLVEEVASGRFDYALFHMRQGQKAGPGMRVAARVPGGVYGHRKFAEGKQLPLDLDELNELPFVFPAAGGHIERQMLSGFSRRGIKPKKIICHTQYYDVIAAMIERGLGVGSLLSALFDPEKLGEIVLLYPTENWELVSFNKHGTSNPRANALEAFMMHAVLEDPRYPRIDER
jgi:DNA-binding transcriptional LysR family regulator